MELPHDYLERVYAGVLGKIIGVYLGRPFEGWDYAAIQARLGDVRYYVHDQLVVPLVVTDDDISGTFTFIRALEDYGATADITPAQIGQTWLNYIVENRSILWWGGMGNSTEHTAYLRLKRGLVAPASGAIATNGQVVAEQIGAQIFIDGWGMVAPGRPALAAELARKAASVSHDGEAIHAAQVVAALEAQAFVERDVERLLDVAAQLIPRDCLISRVIADVRAWAAEEPDWRVTRERIEERYGYHRYGGNCHVVPNHALIIHSLVHGGGDFSRSLSLVNTCGWDTDCNSANVGCILGIAGGLAGVDAGPDWRGPVADRLYLPTADGGRGITDAATEAVRLANLGRHLAGQESVAPKRGARFHFDLSGAVQGFMPDDAPECRGVATAANAPSPWTAGEQCLEIRYRRLAEGRAARIGTATFIPPDAVQMPGYALTACPTLYAGQEVRAGVMAAPLNLAPVVCGLYVKVYGADDRLEVLRSTPSALAPGEAVELCWRIPDTGGQPIAEVGLELTPVAAPASDGIVYLDTLDWRGVPEAVFGRSAAGTMGGRAWVDAVDHVASHGPAEPCRLIQDEGDGLLIQGLREWDDYRVRARINIHMAAAGGIAARVQGLRRYYALLLCADGMARLVKELDGSHVLAEAPLGWRPDEPQELELAVEGNRLMGRVNGATVFERTDDALASGAVALVCREGRLAADGVRIRPISADLGPNEGA